MAFFYSFTESLKQKWLNFFQANRDWIHLHMQVESVYTPDGGKRPPSYLILGVINALEPKLAQLMLPFSKLNPDADTLIEVLDLHFDPDMALGNASAMPKAEESADAHMDMEEMGEGVNGLGQNPSVSNFTVSNSDGENTIAQGMVVGESIAPNLGGGDDGFGGDISFADGNAGGNAGGNVEAAKMEYSNLDEMDAVDGANGFSDVLMDVWGEESQNQQDKNDSEMALGEEFGTGAFDDSEIARLFPNA